MSKAPKDLRIPIMMSSAEVEAIDDWRFSNKIATRAEAVRRLCQIGLLISRIGGDLHEGATEILDHQNEMFDPVQVIIRRLISEGRRSDVDLINNLANTFASSQISATRHVVSLAEFLRTASVVFSSEAHDGVTVEEVQERMSDFIKNGRLPEDDTPA